MVKWHHKDLANRMYINIEGGKKIAMPRYFKNKIYHENQRQAIKFWTVKRMAEDEAKALLAGKIPSARDVAEKDKESFKKMYRNAEHGRNVV